MLSTAYVYIYLQEKWVPAGILEVNGVGRDTISHFRYGQRYLQRKDRIAIDPVQLSFSELAPADREYTTPEGFAIFNGIRDASPDGWGRQVLHKLAGKKILSELDYLTATGDDRIGALAFGPDLSGPQRIIPWQEKIKPIESLDFKELLTLVQEFDSPEDLPEEHRQYLLPGSSLGGARPKATTVMNNKQWIMKFGRKEDQLPICRAEHATMCLAAQLGLRVPAVRLEKILRQHVYFIERFDRIAEDKIVHRIPFISGLTITGAHESESSQQSYRGIAEQLRLYGSQFQNDARELWQRMVFNILCSNTDDHLRNHGFLWDGKGWRLSPVYDLVPYPQVSQERFLAIGVGKDGRHATLSNALTEAQSFSLSKDEALHLAKNMQRFVKANWETFFRESGFTRTELERVRNCFIACDEFL